MPRASSREFRAESPIFSCHRLNATLFNTPVENSVEKVESTLVSSSSAGASTPCTETGAGTFVVELLSHMPDREISPA
jgi:hypothetical protein